MRDWVTNVSDTYYLLGSVLGPHPYPLMVREFQSVIGREARAQIVELAGRLAHGHRRLRRRRQQRDRHLRRVHRRPRRAADRRRGRRRADLPRPARRAVCRRQRGRAAGHAHVRPAGRGRQHRADALDLGRARLRRRRPRARVAARRSAAPSTPMSRTTRRSKRFRRWRGSKAFCRRSNRRTRSRYARSSRPSSGRRACCSSICRAAATKTCRRWSNVFAKLMIAHR